MQEATIKCPYCDRDVLVEFHAIQKEPEEPKEPEIIPRDTLGDILGIAPYDDTRVFGQGRGFKYIGKNPVCRTLRKNAIHIIEFVCNEFYDEYGIIIEILEGSTASEFPCIGHGYVEAGWAHSNLQAVDFKCIETDGIFDPKLNLIFYKKIKKYIPTFEVILWEEHKYAMEKIEGKKIPWIKGDATKKYNHDKHGHGTLNTKSNDDYAWNELV